MNIIIASHGFYARETVNTAGLIIGDIAKRAHVVSVTPEKQYDDCLKEIQELYASFADKESGTLILTDIFGGTPSNISAYLALSNDHVQVYSGFNLPVIMELFIANPDTLEAAGKIIEQAYAVGLININKKMKEGADNGDQMVSY